MTVLGSLSVKLGLDPSQFRNGLTRARATLAGFKASINDSDTTVGKMVKTIENLGNSARDKIGEIARLGVQAGALASAALTAAPFIAKAATSVYQFGAAAVQASPMLAAFGAAFLVVKTVVTRTSQEMLKQFNPFLDALSKSDAYASQLAAHGIAQLVTQFTALNMPAISRGENEIALGMHDVVAGFLNWGKSQDGVLAIRNLMTGTGAAVTTLVPHINRLVASFGNMIGRIAEVSLHAGANGLSGVLDALSGRLDKVNAASVLVGLNKLKADFLAVWHAIQKVIEVTKTAIAFWNAHRAAIKAVQDAVSILAIVFGGPLIAVIALIGIVIRHWDDLKAAYGAVVAYFTSNPIGSGLFDNLMSAVNTVVPALTSAWQTIWGAIGPVLTEIWTKITTQLVPAFGQFLAAIAPIVAFCINILAPVVASVFQNILAVISGAISIITGIIQIFTGILTGDWTMVWEGIKNILSGAWEAIVGIFNLWIFGKIAGLLGRLAGFLGGFFAEAGAGVLRIVADWIANLIGRVGGIPGQILSALGNLGRLLWDAGRNVIQGLIDGIWSMVGAVGSAIGSIASKIRNSLPFSPAKEGPLSGQGAPNIAGAKIVSMLASGMLKQLPLVEGMAARIAAAAQPSITATFSTGLPTPAGVRSVTGSGRDDKRPPVVEFKGTDAILEVIRKLVRDNGKSAEVAFAGRR